MEIPLEVYLYKYRMHFPIISLSEGVENSLKKMRQAGFILGIVTDGRNITQSNKIKALGLEQYISWEDCIIQRLLVIPSHL
ncbi:MAG: HAD family hydrolase [Bacteroides sp.]|nr:HAD family hydrolase [Bacteroides sp.]